MAGAGGPAVEVAIFGCALIGGAAGSAADGAFAGSKSLKHRLDLLERVGFGADHQAIAAVDAPDAAAGADVGVTNAFGFQSGGAGDLVLQLGGHAVDDGVG